MRLIDADKINFRGILDPMMSEDKITLIPLHYAETIINTAPTITAENGNTPWISVKDRLPKHNEKVLCLCHANIYEVLVWDNREREWYHDIEHSYLETFVTHWMPLPAPPEEG